MDNITLSHEQDAFPAWIAEKLRVLHQMRNVLRCFWGISGGYTTPGGEICEARAGRVTIKNIHREQKVTFSGCA